MRRTERLFALTELLRSQRSGINVATIAERFGVTERTVFRDLASLRRAELPLVSERGRGGGIALDRRYSLPPVNFDPREAALLLVAGRVLEELRLVPFTETLARALSKVRGALSRTAQRELDAQLARLAVVGVPSKPAPAAVRRAIEASWLEGRTLLVRYLSREFVETERRIRVERLVLDRHETILHVHDLDKDAERELRLHRVLAAKVVRTG